MRGIQQFATGMMIVVLGLVTLDIDLPLTFRRDQVCPGFRDVRHAHGI